jgi:hypothetical protein
MSSAKEFDPTRATFAGSVAALWLHFAHDLILRAEMVDIYCTSTHSGLCDRIERILTHLESSSMPLPGLSLEDVVQLGREMAADNAEEDRQEGEEEHTPPPPVEMPRKTGMRGGARICARCGNGHAAKVHKEQCLNQKAPAKGDGGCPKCSTGRLYIDGDGDKVCISCGYRDVAPSFGAVAIDVARREVEQRRRAPTHAGDLL